MPMKIKPEHVEYMRQEMQAALTREISRIGEQKLREWRSQVSEKRFRWDLARAAGLLPRWICDYIYPYANDTHFDTALRRIVSDLDFTPAS